MESLVIRSQAIGGAALDALQTASQGQAIGQTSGGFFLRIETGWVLFMSFSAWRGPLTINLSPVDRENLSIALHSPFLVQPGAINFLEAHISVAFNQAERWSPPPRPTEALPLAERSQRFARISTAVLAGLADRSAARGNSLADPGAYIDPDGHGLAALRIALRPREPGDLIAALVRGLGSGSGLTPAGDDLVLGFLLALNRWGDRLCPDLPSGAINQPLIDAARQRTTLLSASLIECAAAGMAAERLVLALDGLVSGNLAEDRIVNHFLDWGHTSGTAALLGMGLVIDMRDEG